jgi:hypothetical protein
MWNATITSRQADRFSYDILSTTDALTDKGTLLRLTFQLRRNVKPGGRSPLVNVTQYPDTKEVTTLALDGALLVDSSCGSTHLTVNATTATFVDQNAPNPVSVTSTTNIPFDIGDDNTVVTLRIVDPTGREVIRPIDHQAYSRGHYSVPVEGKSLGSGIFFYEFKPEGVQPMVKKMVVQ